MKRSRLWLALALVVFLSACGETGTDNPSPDGDSPDGDTEDGDAPDADSDGDAIPDPEIEYDPLDLSFTGSPVDLDGLAVNFAADVPYGDDPLQVFDIFLAPSDSPTPLVIYIHGGGFTGGDKDAIYDEGGRRQILAALRAGASFASINYRLLAEVDKEGVIKPLSDSRRCLQFMRYFSDTLNIDPARVALYGTSAGAGTGLWLGFHDDMADPVNPDPVLRESTRVVAVGAIESQSTYDLDKWITQIFEPFFLTFDIVFAVEPSARNLLLSFYGIDSFEQMYSDEITDYRANVDMLALLSADDPPMWLKNEEEGAGAPLGLGAFFHHPFHARALVERAQEVGLEFTASIPKIDYEAGEQGEVMDFLLHHLSIR